MDKDQTPADMHDPENHDWNAMYSGDASDQQAPDPQVLKILEGLAPGRSLDVGCGAGGLVAALAKRGFQASGIDIATKAVAAARKATAGAGLRADFEVADAAQWTPAQQYDVITSTFALPGTRDSQQKALATMRNAVAPGGTVVIKDFDLSMKARQPAFAAWHLPTAQEMRQAFEGFEIVRAQVVPTPVHDHDGSGSNAGQQWTAVLLHARRLR